MLILYNVSHHNKLHTGGTSMTQVNFTLTQEEVLQILSGNRDEAFKMLVKKLLDQIMLIESAEQLGAERHERTDERQDYRNGTRARILTTRIGTIDINGVSTRKVSRVVEELCGKSFSKSSVSQLCKKLDAEIDAFRNRPLDNLDVPFLMVDATYFKAREDHRIVSKAFMLALAIRPDGVREIVGFDVADAEDNASWQSFFKSLKSRGLNDVSLVISDGHRSILNAIARTYPEAAWQRCQVHFMRNILAETPARFQPGLSTELRNMFTAKTMEEARVIRDGIIDDYGPVAAKAMAILDKGFEDAMTVMLLPEWLRIKLRTTNMIERLNRELKRRSDVVQVFPDPDSVLRLMGAVAMEHNDQLSVKQRVFSQRTYDRIRIDILPKLKDTAMSQQAILDAA